MPEYKCKNKNDAAFVCTNKDCAQRGFICLNTQCCSQNHHKGCNLIPIQQFRSLQLAGGHQNSFDNYILKFTKIYQNIITNATSQLTFLNNLSQFHHKREKDLQMCKQNFQFNLSEDYLTKAIQRWTVFSREYWNQINDQFHNLQNDIEKWLNSMKKTQTLAKNKIQQEKNRISPCNDTLKINSSIVWKQQTIKSLHELLASKQSGIKQLKCLYRASLNSFSTKQFHRSCDGYQSTIVLIKNSKGKIMEDLQVYAGKTINSDNTKKISRNDHLCFLQATHKFILCFKNSMRFRAINNVVLYSEEEQHSGFIIKLIPKVIIGIFCHQHIAHRTENGLSKHFRNLLEQKCMKNIHQFNGKFFKQFMNDKNWHLLLITTSKNFKLLNNYGQFEQIF